MRDVCEYNLADETLISSCRTNSRAWGQVSRWGGNSTASFRMDLKSCAGAAFKMDWREEIVSSQTKMSEGKGRWSTSSVQVVRFYGVANRIVEGVSTGEKFVGDHTIGLFRCSLYRQRGRGTDDYSTGSLSEGAGRGFRKKKEDGFRLGKEGDEPTRPWWDCMLG